MPAAGENEGMFARDFTFLGGGAYAPTTVPGYATGLNFREIKCRGLNNFWLRIDLNE